MWRFIDAIVLTVMFHQWREAMGHSYGSRVDGTDTAIIDDGFWRAVFVSRLKNLTRSSH